MNNRPTRQQLAGGTGRRTTNSIVHTLSTLCTSSAVLADLLAAWARSRRDAGSARLATDALTLATGAHALQEHLAAMLESEAVA
jgi:hypothetical protein